MSDDELIEYEVSSGNIWADLGYPDAAEMQVRSELLLEVLKEIRSRGLSNAQAAEILGATPAVISDIVVGRLHTFSLECLIGFFRALGREDEIVVREAPSAENNERGYVRVPKSRATDDAAA
jgi:predicted XRE-type DNA-binding protein